MADEPLESAGVPNPAADRPGTGDYRDDDFPLAELRREIVALVQRALSGPARDDRRPARR